MRSALFPIALLALCAQGSAPYVSNDIHCPPDLHISFVHNSYTYGAPLTHFINLIDSFFEQSWYFGTVITHTTGKYNVPGATRTGPFAGATYNETLTAYSKHADAMIMSYSGQPLTIVSPPLKFGHYLERLRFESICGGTATYIDALTYSCSDNPVAVYDLWYTVHMAAFANLSAVVGAPVLAGDCLQKSRH
ncbi:hypothetical protein DFH08DRAFT_447715 [Mycena albidolilacea]|uniref:Uncharacterized protein n=1 Tax=Mycena albidolilacea TaxID=1033008 RepID=A0AAD6Z9J1_9AGAR|nr:hypothetical protein DFH08DRAFT_447715 [Mycena albidolilacea]